MLYTFLSLILSFLVEHSHSFTTFSSFARQHHRILTARSRRIQEEYDYDDNDDVYYRNEQTRFREDRQLDDIYEDYSSYYEDDNYRANAAPVPLQPRRRPVSRSFADIEKSMYEDSMESSYYNNNNYDEEEEYYEDDMSTPGGNYWSNPRGKQDADVVGRRQQRPPTQQSPPRPSTATAPPHRRRNGRTKRTTFRSGTPPPPEPVEDFYNKLFWFGFDPSADPEADSSDKKTMFGGTKGKFNGLSYINEGVGVLPREVRGRRRPRNVDESGDSFWEEEDDEYDDEPEAAYDGYKRQYDRDRFGGYRDSVRATSPRPRPYPQDEYERPRRRRQPSGDWVTNEVSGWFEDNDEEERYDREEDLVRKKKSSRKRSKSTSMWSPFNALDSFFAPGNLDEKAYEYDRRMGIGSRRLSQPPSRRSRPRRKGYAYPYDEEDYEVVKQRGDQQLDDDDDDFVIDADLVVVEEVKEEENSVKDQKSTNTEANVEMSWEERALAMERVPPPDVLAWGPTGEEGVDARSKAILDAMEDINSARRTVEERRKKIEQCKEDLVILRVDSELEQKRFRTSRLDPRIVQDKLRRMQRKIDDASRAVRLAQARFDSARDALRELESRHWAVLSFYDPNRAESAIQDALRELGESEPAVRRFMEKNGKSATSSTVQTERMDTDAKESKPREETDDAF